MTNLIAKPGVYDISIAEYHSQCCDGPSLSRSDLWKIRTMTPAHFWATSSLNPDGEKEPRSQTLDFGAAAHSILLEGTLPETVFALSPFDDFRNKAAQEWRDQQIADGLIIVRQTDLEQIKRMSDALHRHPMIRDGLFRGEVERSVFWQEKGVWLKSRPDVIPADTILADYKTVSSASPEAVAKSCAIYGYHLQLAMAADGIKAVTGKKIEHAALVVQEKSPPYLVQVYALSEHYLYAGRLEYMAALDRFIHCYGSGHWPGYTDDTLLLPDWKQLALEAEGLLKGTIS